MHDLAYKAISQYFVEKFRLGLSKMKNTNLNDFSKNLVSQFYILSIFFKIKMRSNRRNV